ncbi:hypothetical protein [Thermomonospora cellulosilytica]|uniref:Uncharacterized protein n=1 Tax=Thermomonospora cellulosilytica TaxID=1411118 RepID=A0A7W3MXJ0_9ACTN|nr:hypothetical protein [Thermomonospora cellulosilytica]MBA9003681.1 hypothetical protein [Thermomonospora cellulosilytica]
MKPEDVPAELVDLLADTVGVLTEREARRGLAAVLPAHEAAVIARAADEIAQGFILADDDPFDQANNAVRDVVRHLRVRADRIARGETR